jgi:hypothetical protein
MSLTVLFQENFSRFGEAGRHTRAGTTLAPFKRVAKAGHARQQERYETGETREYRSRGEQVTLSSDWQVKMQERARIEAELRRLCLLYAYLLLPFPFLFYLTLIEAVLLR